MNTDIFKINGRIYIYRVPELLKSDFKTLLIMWKDCVIWLFKHLNAHMICTYAFKYFPLFTRADLLIKTVRISAFCVQHFSICHKEVVFFVNPAISRL